MNNIFYIIAVICAVWVIFDVWTKQKMDTGMKIVWTIFAIILSVLTAIIYYFTKKR